MSTVTPYLQLVKPEVSDTLTPSVFSSNFQTIDNAYHEISKDYVVAYGTQGDWTYRKWESGIMECAARISVSFTTNIAWGALYRTNLDLYDQNYPVYFNATPVLLRSFDSSAGTSWALACSGASATKTGGTMFANPVQASESGYLSYYALGWWK